MSQSGGIFNLQLLVTFRQQLSYFPHTMLVIVRGDPAFTKTEVIGLDILAPRHPETVRPNRQQVGLRCQLDHPRCQQSPRSL